MKKFKISGLIAAIFLLTVSVFAEITPMGHVQFRTSEYRNNVGYDQYSDSGYIFKEGFYDFNWYMKRARIGASYKNDKKPYGGVLYFAMDKAQNSESQITPIYLYGWYQPHKMVKLVLGQFKVPYTRESTRSSAKMYVSEWGVATNTLFDYGVYAHITPMTALDVYFSVVSGFNTKLTGVNNAMPNDYQEAFADQKSGTPQYVLRAQYQVMGKKVDAGMEAFTKEMGLNVGVFASYSKDYGAKALATTSISDDNANDYSFMGAGADIQFYMNGIVANALFTYEMIKSTYSGTNTTSKDIGIMTEIGYNLALGQFTLMPAVRFEYQITNTGATGAKDIKEMSIAAGINFHIDQYKQRLAAYFYQIKQSVGASWYPNAVQKDGLTAMDYVTEQRIEVEYQLVF